MKIDLDVLGYRWKGVYSPFIAYKERDVVFKDGGAHVIRGGVPQPFALGQQDAIIKGHLLTGGVSVGGVGGMTLHSNADSSIEFRFTDDRNGTTCSRLMETVQNHRTPYASNCNFLGVMTDGSVRGVGRAFKGILGDGSVSDVTRRDGVRAAFPRGVKIARVIVANADSYYIDTNGGLWHSGYNVGDWVGGRGVAGPAYIPKLINGNSGIPASAKIVDVVSSYGYYGYPNVLALDSTGRVYAWGYNTSGCLGLGHTNGVNTATLIPFTATTPIAKIFVNGNNYGVSCLVDYDGNAWVAGNDTLNFMAVGTHITTHQRLELGGRRVKKMFWGEDDQHWVAGSQYDWGAGILFENGDVYIRGTAPSQVGMDGGGWTMSTYNTPFTNKFHSGVKDIWVQFGGYQCAVALMNDGTVQARGNQSYGENGLSVATTVWTTIGGTYLQNVTKLSMMGSQYGSTLAALRGDGKLVVWGGNMQGCVGDGRAPGTGDNFPDSFYLSDRPIVDFCWGGYRYEGTGANVVYALNDLGQVLAAGAGDYNANGDDDSENALTPQLLRF